MSAYCRQRIQIVEDLILGLLNIEGLKREKNHQPFRWLLNPAAKSRIFAVNHYDQDGRGGDKSGGESSKAHHPPLSAGHRSRRHPTSLFV